MMKKPILLATIVTTWLGLPSGEGAVVSNVPMGGAMVHASVLYNAAANRLEAHVDPVVPRLTPLDLTNPADNFFTGDPWFPCLDPSGEGLAFNRQYGFVMDAATDPLPSGVGIWIRKTSCTPGLRTYRYRATDPKAWEPMFGWLGSTNLWQWNLAMFHPAVAALPSDGAHSATFEAFAVDLATGQPRTDIAVAPFTLNWTVAPSGRPVLQLGSDRVLSWPATATNYVVETSASLASVEWVAVTNLPVLKQDRFTLVVDASAGRRFYRLKRNP